MCSPKMVPGIQQNSVRRFIYHKLEDRNVRMPSYKYMHPTGTVQTGFLPWEVSSHQMAELLW